MMKFQIESLQLYISSKASVSLCFLKFFYLFVYKVKQRSRLNPNRELNKKINNLQENKKKLLIIRKVKFKAQVLVRFFFSLS